MKDRVNSAVVLLVPKARAMGSVDRHETAGEGRTAVFDVAPGGIAEVDLQLAK